MNNEGPRLLWGFAEDHPVLSKPRSLKEKAAHPQRQPSLSSQRKGPTQGDSYEGMVKEQFWERLSPPHLIPAADSLTALMNKWPPNNVTLFAATHSKLRKASDGTDTQVAICIINKWTVKINKRRIYNGKCPLGENGDKKRMRKRRKTVAVLRTPESSCREAPKNREEEEFILGQSSRINFYPFSMHSAIPLPYGLVRLLKLSLRPSSWAHFSTKFIVLSLLGLGSFTSTVKDLPKVDPTLCFLHNFRL